MSRPILDPFFPRETLAERIGWRIAKTALFITLLVAGGLEKLFDNNDSNDELEPSLPQY